MQGGHDHRRASSRTKAGLAFALLVLAVAPATRSQLVTADLEGQVRSASEPLAGATVEAVDAASGRSRVSITDERGRYRIPALDPGEYRLRTSLDGFVTQIRQQLSLSVGRVTTIDFDLEPEPTAAVSDAIVVTAEEPLVEKTESDIGIVVDGAQVASLPLNSRNVMDLALLSAGVNAFQDSSTPPFSPLQFGAQNNKATALLVDGIDHSNELIGGILGTSPGMVPQNAVAQLEVVSHRFKAEHGGSAGGIVNVVTRRGSNELKGGVFVFFRDEQLNARNAFDTTKPPFERQQYGIDLGGPLVKDRTHFFTALERNDQSNFVVVNTGGVFPELEGTFPKPFETTRLLAKLDHDIDSSQWLAARYLLLDHESGEFYGGNIARSAGITAFEDVTSLSVGHLWSASNRVLNELRAGFVDWGVDTRPFDDGPHLIYPSVEAGRWPGGEQRLRLERLQLRDDVHLLTPDLLGEHNWKLGASFTRVKSGDSEDSLSTGLFIFPFDRAPVPVVGVIAVGDPDAGTIVNEKVALYLQDDWTPRADLTLNLGLRYDRESNASNQDFVSSKTDPQLPFIVRGNRPVDDDNIGVRLGFAWDVTGTGKGVVRGGWGIYYGRIIAALPFEEIASDQYRTYTILGPGTTDVGAIDLTGRPFQISALLPETVETPYAVQYSLGVSWQLSPAIALDADVIGSRGYHELFARRDTNPLGPPTFVRALPQYQEVYVGRDDGRSAYDALRLVLRKRMQRNFELRASYTLAEAENDFDDDFFSGLAFGRGPAAWDTRHRIVVDGRLELPAGTSLTFIGGYSSGRRYTVFTGVDANFNGDLTDDQPPGVGRNSAETGDQTSIDVRFSKLFELGGVDLELLAEVFNLLNSTNYDPSSYVGNLSSPNFGQPTAALAPRQGQLGVRLRF